MRALLLALVLLGACRRDSGWTIVNGDSAQTEQALDLLEAARTVTGHPLAYGWVDLVRHPHQIGNRDGAVLTGLATCPGMSVLLWEAQGLGPDLLNTSLAHELAHCTMPQTECSPAAEAEADRIGALIVEEYRRASR